MKRLALPSMAAVAVLGLSACGAAPEEEGSTAGGGEGTDYKACIVSDAGGWDDQSFNQSTKEALDQAVADFGIESAEAQSAGDSDFAPNVDSMVQQGCNLVIGAGFLLEDALQSAAEANPDVDFALVDSSFADADGNPVELENGKPLLFNTAEAAYLGGYLAAGVTETDKVATFGGIQIPSVAIFMDGFVDGVAAYNEAHGTEVEVLGWDKDAQNGAFSGDFENVGQGKTLSEQFIAQGADVIMPVAGPVGEGAAQAAADAEGTRIIWVDTDGFESTEYGDVMLSSVMKGITTAVYDTIESGVNGEFSAEPFVGTIENEGVGLAPYHDHEGDVPAELQTEIDDLRAQIAAGELVVESPNAP
ncbi:BMP family lipoprotein [Brevibacterium litoralis]|uniref:BMP family lipoprotein n=1 Tax=Brevibacterium litoralis TaxID=3138935 RepID=UPI0032ED0951